MAHKKVMIIKVEGTPEWMISFGDLLSCLLVFFVLMLTFTSNKSGKLMDMIGESMEPGAPGKASPGALPGEAGKDESTSVDPEALTPMKIEAFLISNTFMEFKKRIFNIGFKESVTVQDLSDGILIAVPMSKLFSTSSSVELTKAGISMTEALANVTASIGNELRMSRSLPEDLKEPVQSEQTGVRQLLTIRDALHGKYRIPLSRMSFCSSSITKDQEPVFSFLIASKIDDKLLTLEDYLMSKR